MSDDSTTFNISYINTKLVDGMWTYIHSWQSVNTVTFHEQLYFISVPIIQQTLQQSKLLSPLLTINASFVYHNDYARIIILNDLDQSPFMILHTESETPIEFLKTIQSQFR